MRFDIVDFLNRNLGEIIINEFSIFLTQMIRIKIELFDYLGEYLKEYRYLRWKINNF